MSLSNIYRMVLDGKEYVGKATELCQIAGYQNPACIGMINRGDMYSRKGLEIECIGKEESTSSPSNWREDGRIKDEWDRVVGKFKNVEWVGRGTQNAKELVVTK